MIVLGIVDFGTFDVGTGTGTRGLGPGGRLTAIGNVDFALSVQSPNVQLGLEQGT